MNIKQLVNDFESLTLSDSEWNHANHLRIALWYAYTETNFYRAAQKIKCAWIRYGTNKPLSVCHMRYHETITLFWAYKLSKFVKKHNSKTFEEVELLLLQDKKFTNKNYLSYFYSKKILYSQKARTTFVYPNTFRYLALHYGKPGAQYAGYAIICAFFIGVCILPFLAIAGVIESSVDILIAA